MYVCVLLGARDFHFKHASNPILIRLQMQMAKLTHGSSMPVLTQTESIGGGGGGGGWLHPSADPFSNGGLLNSFSPAPAAAQPPSTIHHMETHQSMASMQPDLASRQHLPGKDMQTRYAKLCVTTEKC